MFRMFDNLSVKTKIGLAIALPIIALIGYSMNVVMDRNALSNSMAQIEFVAKRAPAISNFVHSLQQERGLSAGTINSRGATEFVSSLASQRAITDQESAKARAALEEIGGRSFSPSMNLHVQAASQKMVGLAQVRGQVDGLSIKAPEMAAFYGDLIAKLTLVIQDMVELSTDARISADITAYSTLIQAKERAGKERAMGAAGFSRGVFSPQILARFQGYIAEQQSFLWVYNANAAEELVNSYNTIVSGSAVAEVDRMREIVRSSINSGSLQGVTGKQWYEAITAKINLMKQVEDKVSEHLVHDAEEIHAAADQGFVIALSVTIIVLAIALLLAYLGVRSVTGPLSFLLRMLDDKDVSLEGIDTDRSDELGQLTNAMVGFRSDGLVNARLKVALDNCQANVMVADEDLNIVYMNETMVAMMRNAESDLKRDLPNLDASKLIGTNVDVFHKNPAHQRGMIANLTSAYNTTIEVGGRTFNLIASPVVDADGTRLGTVVEWDDVTEKLAAERQAQNVANENLRVKIALDSCQANVMVADADLNIVYMNSTMVAMMRNAEADIKRDLPNLDVSRLIGTNVDVFHKNPAHQRGMIEALTGAYETQIEVGGRTFDLIASPVLYDEGNRLGTVVEWDDVTEKLAEERETQRVADENLRVKIALDNCTANVMVANNEYDIIYMNDAVLGMMRNAEAQIRQDLPGFETAKLVGSSIDTFHKNPAHQRGMLEKLDSTYETSITVGGRTFDLVANPIINSEGDRLGTVVEWQDVTLELAIQKEVDTVVGAVGAGDFTKSLPLEGKEGFMLNLSEAINGLKETVNAIVGDVAQAASTMAQGDLTSKIETEYQGTYDTLKQDLNQMVDRLSATVSEIMTTSNEIASASSEIASGSTDLSQRTEQQASNLQQTAASMEEMATTIKQNADNAQQANQLAISARQTAETGGQVVGNAVEAMSKIEEASQKVSDIIGVIDEIAFQTNLLALNAAVEAARAGEAGKGFAVVASEVRTLAQRSSEAAKDIKSLILDSDVQVKEGVELVNNTGQTLEEIVDGVKKVADIISEIAAASREQSTGAEEINAAITNMDEMTQQNAALVEESTAAARSLEQQSDSLRDMMQFFKLNAQQMARPAAAAAAANPAADAGSDKAKAPAAAPAPAAPPKPMPVPAGGGDDDWEEF